MRRFLRLFTLWLFALALPLQGAAAVTGMAGQAHAPAQTMTQADGSAMEAGAMPCHAHAHAIDKAGCGSCCGPLVTQQAMLVVAPVAVRWATLPSAAADAAAAQFLTGGTDRPPRPALA